MAALGPKVKLNSPGIAELARSSGVQRVLMDTALKVVGGGTAEIRGSVGRGRARVAIIGRGREVSDLGIR